MAATKSTIRWHSVQTIIVVACQQRIAAVVGVKTCVLTINALNVDGRGDLRVF